MADDLMPAVLTALPLLLVLLLLSLTGQHALLRSIVQEGNPLGLTALLLPLFLPTIAASLVYLARQRGWLGWTLRATNWAAAGLAAGFAIFVPLNYLLLQLIAFLVSLGWIWGRRRLARHRRGIAIVAIIVLAALVVEEGLAESGWPRYSLSRIAVGRVVDGLTRMNLGNTDAKPKRSVLVVSVNDGYAIVASTGYPPRMESMAPSELAGGRPDLPAQAPGDATQSLPVDRQSGPGEPSDAPGRGVLPRPVAHRHAATRDGAEGHAADGEGFGEGGVPVAAEQPSAVDRDAAGGHGCGGAVRVVAGQRVVVDHRDVDPGFTSGVGFGREVVVGQTRP
ncbi:hypothetical protein AB0H57_26330 [Micromonospora sp. NPDC050686]|uniref:hypothetical protein n=1 Tax=Micromonospora sp. NPDC050686 TaxID=3154631 RepID=UPI00340DE4E8